MSEIKEKEAGTAFDTDTEEDAMKEAEAKEAAVKEAVPDEAAVKEAVPDETAGKEAVPKETAVNEGVLTPWIHKVQYYETDQMQVVHHSNFVRWFEECRVHVLDEIGYGYDRLEAEGIMSPVLSIEAKIVKSVRFGETVKIRAAIEKFDGIRLTLKYEVRRKSDDELCCTGATGHCFLGRDGRLISLKRKYPEVYEALCRFPTEFI